MKQRLIEARNLRGPGRRCQYRGGLTFEMEEGELVVLYAPEYTLRCADCRHTSHLSQLLRTIARIERPEEGEIIYRGQDIAFYEGERLRALRREIQFVFTDTDLLLNPKMSIKDTLLEVLQYNGVDEDGWNERLLDFLYGLRLDAHALNILSGICYPDDLDRLSRFKVGLARSLLLDPRLVVVDLLPPSYPEGPQMISAILQAKKEFGFSVIAAANDPQEIAAFGGRVVEHTESFAPDRV